MDYIGVYVIVVVAIQLTVDADIRLPPSIYSGPVNDTIFRSAVELKLLCKATGNPIPQYQWFWNGKLLDVNQVNMKLSADPMDGTLTINPIIILNEGYYQCKARNIYGTSMSGIVRLQQADLKISPSTETRAYPVNEGEPLQVQCKPPERSVPQSTFSWATVNDQVDSKPRPFLMNDRIQMNPDGTLFFAHVQVSDEQLGKLYKCNAFNAYTDTLAGGSYSEIIVTPKPNAGDKPPSLLYATEQDTVALLGGNLLLKCFFAGKPAPKLYWKKVGQNSAIAPGRYDFKEHSTEVHIHSIQESDEGSYECQGKNSAGSTKHEIRIKVESVPVFIQSPANTNATEGNDQIFTCKAAAEPKADINWYINGELLDAKSPGERREILAGGTQLVLRELCKTCPGGGSDLMVVQCNASNVHGYVFSDGYLNVLERTNITAPPESLTMSPDNATEAVFDCEAGSDESTPITIVWSLRGRRLYPEFDPRLEVFPNNSLYVNLTWLDRSGLARYAGTYRCWATNLYSHDEAFAELTFPGVQPIDPDPVPAGFPWWLVLAVVLAVLLFIIIILCCYCCNRPKEVAYNVDEKERSDGNDPVKELYWDGYMVYNRPELGTLKRSRASIGSTMTLERSRRNSTPEPESLRGSRDHLTPL